MKHFQWSEISCKGFRSNVQPFNNNSCVIFRFHANKFLLLVFTLPLNLILFVIIFSTIPICLTFLWNFGFAVFNYLYLKSLDYPTIVDIKTLYAYNTYKNTKNYSLYSSSLMHRIKF